MSIQQQIEDIQENLKFVCELPSWADDRAKIGVSFVPSNWKTEIFLSHPDHPPHKLNRETKTWEEIKPKESAF